MYQLREGTKVEVFHSASLILQHQLVNASGKRAAVNQVVAELAAFLTIERTGPELDEFASSHRVAPADLRDNIEKGPLQRFFQSQRSAPLTSGAKVGEGLHLRVDLLQAACVRRLSEPLSVLFNKWLSGLIVTVTGAIYVLAPHRMPKHMHLSLLEWAYVWVLAYVAVLFHELGHASACVRYGAKPGSIGFGLYLCFPVLFTDASNAWALDRKERVIVDVAGIYFHLMCGAVSSSLFWLTGSPVWFLLTKSIILSTIVNLNPFLKFDGYWLLTDWSGIPCLRKSVNEGCRYLWDRCRRNSAGDLEMPLLLRVPRKVQVLLAVYGPASMAFFCFFLYKILLGIPRRVHEIPSNVHLIISDLHSQHLGFQVFHEIFLFALSGWGLYTVGRMLWRRGQRAIQGCRSLVMSLGGGNR